MSEDSDVIIVVGAAIIDNGRLLAAQRAYPGHLAGGWELPGGKVDDAESEQEALIRECREELGVEISIRGRVGQDWSIGSDAVLRVWEARIVGGRPQAREHAALRWLSRDELDTVSWLPADRPLLPHLRGLLDSPR